MANADGSLGPQINRRDLDCPSIFEQSGKLSSGDVPVGANGVRACAIQAATKYTASGRVKTLSSGAARLAALIASIAVDMGRPLVDDKTGLDGYYEFTLEYGASLPSCLDGGGQNAVPLVTALREQLGLKLVSGDQVVSVLVVDRIHRPTED